MTNIYHYIQIFRQSPKIWLALVQNPLTPVIITTLAYIIGKLYTKKNKRPRK